MVTSAIGAFVDFNGIPQIGFAQYMKTGSARTPQSIARPPDSQLEFAKALRNECAPESVRDKPKKKAKKTSRDDSSPRRMSRQSRHESRK